MYHFVDIIEVDEGEIRRLHCGLIVSIGGVGGSCSLHNWLQHFLIFVQSLREKKKLGTVPCN